MKRPIVFQTLGGSMGTKPCLQRYQKSRISAGGNVVPGAAGRPHLFAAIGLPEKKAEILPKRTSIPCSSW